MIQRYKPTIEAQSPPASRTSTRERDVDDIRPVLASLRTGQISDKKAIELIDEWSRGLPFSEFAEAVESDIASDRYDALALRAKVSELTRLLGEAEEWIRWYFNKVRRAREAAFYFKRQKPHRRRTVVFLKEEFEQMRKEKEKFEQMRKEMA